MNMDRRAFRLYALAMLPVARAAAWFVFRHDAHRNAAVPVPAGSAAVRIGERSFSVEIADTRKSREHGLADRDALCASCAMLFRFDAPGKYGFWMKGMRFPLDLAWIRDGKIVHIERDIPADSPAIMKPEGDATEVIETNAGALSDATIGDAVGTGVAPNR